MNNIGIFNETSVEIKELKEVESLLTYALKHENLDNIEFNLIIVSDAKIKELNKQYRNKDTVTDVISFALEDFKDIEYNGFRVLGDIYVSLDRAQEQAIEYKHSFLREISFLSIHGLLHLLGHDHMNIDEETIMFNKQKEILDNYGITR